MKHNKNTEKGYEYYVLRERKRGKLSAAETKEILRVYNVEKSRPPKIGALSHP